MGERQRTYTPRNFRTSLNYWMSPLFQHLQASVGGERVRACPELAEGVRGRLYPQMPPSPYDNLEQNVQCRRARRCLSRNMFAAVYPVHSRAKAAEKQPTAGLRRRRNPEHKLSATLF